MDLTAYARFAADFSVGKSTCFVVASYPAIGWDYRDGLVDNTIPLVG